MSEPSRPETEKRFHVKYAVLSDAGSLTFHPQDQMRVGILPRKGDLVVRPKDGSALEVVSRCHLGDDERGIYIALICRANPCRISATEIRALKYNNRIGNNPEGVKDTVWTEPNLEDE